MNFRQKLTETLAHWHRLHPWKQHSTLLFLGVFTLSFPLQHYWQQRVHMTHMEQQLQTQRENLAHQQKLLAALKEKAATQLLTPALAAKLPPINQQIQQFAQHLQIVQSQWDFHQKPLLRLQLQGHFKDLHSFLTALLNANTELELVEWQVLQIDEANEASSIQTGLLFQLNSQGN